MWYITFNKDEITFNLNDNAIRLAFDREQKRHNSLTWRYRGEISVRTPQKMVGLIEYF